MSRRTSRVVAVAFAFALLTMSQPAAGAPVSGSQSAKQDLIEAYSPIVQMKQRQDPPCDYEGEQYRPTGVDAVLGNPEVLLKQNQPDGSSTTIKRAPTREDLALAGDDTYLDLKGDPLGETCEFARDFDTLKAKGDAPPVVYAHLARENGHSGLVVQYWFYWYFNQFNDLHESDWEGMQIAFDAETAEEAIENGPSEMILFQHAGGERANWNDSKVEKRGTHPVVYPAAGSHATFYYPAVFVENGSKGSGVGCDTTSDPSTEVIPEPVLMPDHATTRGEFKWLAFDGRWGQKEKSFNNGPTGPQTKTQWEEPFSWMAQQRQSSPRLPGGGLVGPSATNAFCGVIAGVTGVMNLEQGNRPAFFVIVGIFLTIVVLLFGVTKWGPVDVSELKTERTYGQIMRSAFQVYRKNWKVLVPLGAIAIPIVGGVQLLADFLGNEGTSDSIWLSLSDLLQGLGRPVASAIVSATVVVFAGALAARRAVSARGSIAGVRARFWRVVAAQLMATIGVLLLAMTIIGLPLALSRLVGWAFVQQEVLYTDKTLRESFRGSSDLVRGRWWHAARTIVVLSLVGIILGPALSIVLIFTPLPLILLNLIGSLVYALLIPFMTMGETLLYFDLEARRAAEPARPFRSWKPWKPRQFGRLVDVPVPG